MEDIIMNNPNIIASTVLFLTPVLIVLSLLTFIGTIVFRKRMSDETAHILFGLFPLEFCILFFGTLFLLAVSFFFPR